MHQRAVGGALRSPRRARLASTDPRWSSSTPGAWWSASPCTSASASAPNLGGGPPRQPVARAPPARGAAPQGRRAARGGGHGLAGAGHRHRRRRSRLRGRLAAIHRGRAPAHRPLRPHARGHAQGALLPAHARSAPGVRVHRPGRAAAASSTPSPCGTRRSTSSPSRSPPSPPARTAARTRSSIWCAGRPRTATSRAPPSTQVVTMLAEGVSSRRGRVGALVHRDAVNRRLRGRRGARLAALTSGGAIPDNANYDVLELPEGGKVGDLDEDFAIESHGGRHLPPRQHLVAHPPRGDRARSGSRTPRARRRPCPSGSARRRRARPSSPPRSAPCARRSPAASQSGRGRRGHARLAHGRVRARRRRGAARARLRGRGAGRARAPCPAPPP